MVLPQRYSTTLGLLQNSRGYITFCECCCPNLPASLYLHIIPTFVGSGDLDDECTAWDQGSALVHESGYGVGTSEQNFCISWLASEVEIVAELQCFDPTGPPPNIPWHPQAMLYCVPPNDFRMDVCFGLGTAGDEDFPDSTTDCEEALAELSPSSSNTCEAKPGEFFVEFDPIIPGATTSGGYCKCGFIFRWDENPQYIQANAPLYYMNKAGAEGLPGNVGGSLRQLGDMYGVGTPPTSVEDYFQ